MNIVSILKNGEEDEEIILSNAREEENKNVLIPTKSSMETKSSMDSNYKGSSYQATFPRALSCELDQNNP